VITTPVLIDTGPLVAILRQDDHEHESCVRQLQDIRRPAFTCWPVLTEASYLLGSSAEFGICGLISVLKIVSCVVSMGSGRY